MGDNYDFNKEIEFEMQIGSKNFPEYPLRSMCEQFYQLRKTLGIHVANEQVDLDTVKYRRNHFIMGLGTEKDSRCFAQWILIQSR